MSEPTLREVERVLHVREVGARLAEGPWHQRARGRWGIPVVAYMSREPLPDQVVHKAEGGWAVDKAATRASTELDPDLALYGTRRGLG